MLALTPDATAMPIDELAPEVRAHAALVLGAEGSGLAAAHARGGPHARTHPDGSGGRLPQRRRGRCSRVLRADPLTTPTIEDRGEVGMRARLDGVGRVLLASALVAWAATACGSADEPAPRCPGAAHRAPPPTNTRAARPRPPVAGAPLRAGERFQTVSLPGACLHAVGAGGRQGRLSLLPRRSAPDVVPASSPAPRSSRASRRSCTTRSCSVSIPVRSPPPEHMTQ